MPGFLALIAIVAAVAAVFLYVQWQSAASAVSALKADADAARKEAETARGGERKIQEELKARGVQLQETREKLADLRKKSSEGKGVKAQPRGVREAELEEDLTHARQLTEQAHAAEVTARREAQAAKGDLERLRAELTTAQSKVRELSARPSSVVGDAPAVSASGPAQADFEAQRTQLEAARNELERQVKQAERTAADARKKEQELRDEVRKHKGRSETNNRVYMVTRGELELTRERLAQAERKLWQAGIPLEKPAAPERPRAKGPASADRPREAPAAVAAAPGGGVAVSVVAPAASAAPAGEPISAGEAAITQPPPAAEEAHASQDEGTPTPVAVEPIRRRPENGADVTKP